VYQTNLLAGVTALMAGATMGIGYYMYPPPAGPVGALMQYGQQPLAVIPRLAQIGWSAYTSSMLGRDCAALINLTVRKIIERGRDYWAGPVGDDLAEFANRYQEMQPDSVDTIAALLEEEATRNFWQAPNTRVIIPPGATESEMDSLISDLPEIPYPQPRGQQVIIRMEDGTERVMLLPVLGGQQVTDIRFAPLVRVDRSTLDRIARSMSNHEEKAPDGEFSPSQSEDLDVSSVDDQTVALSVSQANHSTVMNLADLNWGVSETTMLALLNRYQQFFSYSSIIQDGNTLSLLGFVPMGDGRWGVVFLDPEKADGTEGRFVVIYMNLGQIASVLEPGSPPAEVGDIYSGGRVEWDTQRFGGFPQDDPMGTVLMLSFREDACVVGLDAGEVERLGLGDAPKIMLCPTIFLTRY
jgi:hypothetical protein